MSRASRRSPLYHGCRITNLGNHRRKSKGFRVIKSCRFLAKPPVNMSAIGRSAVCIIEPRPAGAKAASRRRPDPRPSRAAVENLEHACLLKRRPAGRRTQRPGAGDCLGRRQGGSGICRGGQTLRPDRALRGLRSPRHLFARWPDTGERPAGRRSIVAIGRRRQGAQPNPDGLGDHAPCLLGRRPLARGGPGAAGQARRDRNAGRAECRERRRSRQVADRGFISDHCVVCRKRPPFDWGGGVQDIRDPGGSAGSAIRSP